MRRRAGRRPTVYASDGAVPIGGDDAPWSGIATRTGTPLVIVRIRDRPGRWVVVDAPTGTGQGALLEPDEDDGAPGGDWLIGCQRLRRGDGLDDLLCSFSIRAVVSVTYRPSRCPWPDTWPPGCQPPGHPG